MSDIIDRDPELVEIEVEEVEDIEEIELPEYDHSDFVLPEDVEFTEDDE